MNDRMQGMSLGFLVAVAFAAAGAVIGVALLSVPLRDVVGGVLVPTIATGIVAGYLFGRRASRRLEWGDRVLQSLGMAVVATAVGDLFVGFAMGYASADGGANIAAQLVQGAASAVVLWPFGILIYGLVGLPITFLAAIVWSVLMARLVRDNG